MKKHFVLALALSAATLTIAATPQIPKSFLGNWAETQADCIIPAESPIDFPDSGIKISHDAIHQYETACSLTKLISQSDNALSAEFLCSDSEGEQTVEKTLSLSADGKQLTGFDDRTLLRCK